MSMERRGIILAGGAGTRLSPVTHAISKQLLPVFDKPMIYYPISVLMLANIRDILIITTPRDMPSFQNLLGDGSAFGLRFDYAVQDHPRGLADAFIIGERFIGDHLSALVLGDNICYGEGFSDHLACAAARQSGATVFSYPVHNPSQFGVVEFDEKGRAISLEEKPTKPKSNQAVVGLYFYDQRVIEMAKTLQPSSRGELEITDLNRSYMQLGELNVEELGRGFAWFDSGSTSAMLDAANFVATIQRRQGLQIACLEEIALSKNWITTEDVKRGAEKQKNSEYGAYLFDLLESVS